MDERRQFSRILFAATAHLSVVSERWETKILDLSLNGALVEKPTQFPTTAKQVNLTFFLPESDVELKMEAELVHDEGDQLGLRCLNIDVDSISHLRRIIELNLGDASLLNRELELFIADHDASQP